MPKSVFTVLFMIVISTVFIAALAVVNSESKPRIMMNAELQSMKSVLYAFGMLPGDVKESNLPGTMTTQDLPWNDSRIMAERDSAFTSRRVAVPDSLRPLLKDSYLTPGDSVTILVRQMNGRDAAYGFQLKGKGLWGTITAFAVISADLRHMEGIDFTDQVETPGLGARITEQEFKYFFRNLDLSCFPDHPCIVMVRSKDRSNLDNPTSELQAVTGATLTSNGVRNMLNTDLRFYITLLRGQISSQQSG